MGLSKGQDNDVSYIGWVATPYPDCAACSSWTINLALLENFTFIELAR
jgi:hypothetical protein